MKDQVHVLFGQPEPKDRGYLVPRPCLLLPPAHNISVLIATGWPLLHFSYSALPSSALGPPLHIGLEWRRHRSWSLAGLALCSETSRSTEWDYLPTPCCHLQVLKEGKSSGMVECRHLYAISAWAFSWRAHE